MTEPRELSSASLVRLVAVREISARVRDKNFIISSIVIIVVLIGLLAMQVALNSGTEETRIGVVGNNAGLEQALQAQGDASRSTSPSWTWPTTPRRGRRWTTRRSTAPCSPTAPSRS